MINQDPTTDLIRRDLRNEATEEEKRWLRSDDFLDEWHAKLINITKDIDVQLAERKAVFEEAQSKCWRDGREGKHRFFDEVKPEYSMWRGKALRAKRSAQKRVDEAKRLIQERSVRNLGNAHALPSDPGKLRVHAAKMSAERALYRKLLHEASDFLVKDERLAPECLEERDELLIRIGEGLRT